jgi:hypothetical protein
MQPVASLSPPHSEALLPRLRFPILTGQPGSMTLVHSTSRDVKSNSLNRLVVLSISGSLIVNAPLLGASHFVCANVLGFGTHHITHAEVMYELEKLKLARI